ncbi:MAG: hypothetical protein A3K19_24785 [Lentisphaerae bacterium RIFOXYB12_FULL_65_16]|nr:MAG: hypothetical protein A3K18_24200 [Lentisphaerae bacterium RIFOXYA12_64_32]OGV90688.1 MAG: hypothetical protein A3K19_24785 [Lentisphaerae bacterium RIFOXYB12_FULL_65_16]
MDERPGRVTLLGWVLILIGISEVVNALKSHLKTREVFGALGSLPDGTRGTLLTFIQPLLTPAGEAMVLVAVGGCMILLGISVLRLRPWARVGAECAAWLLLASVIVGGGWVSWKLACGSGQPSGPPFRGMALVLLVAAAVATVVHAAAAAGLLWLARCRVTREAFGKPDRVTHAGPPCALSESDN